MTNKDAITSLRNAAWLGSDADRERTEQAVEMAIEALEGKDTNVSGKDTIDRQAAIDVASGYCHPANIAQELAKLPSAQPDRGYVEQIKWERDLAIQQFKDLGYGLGEKTRTQPKAEACDRPCTEDDYWNCNDCDHMEVCRYYPMKVCEYKSQPSAQSEPKRGRWKRAYLDHEAMGERPSVLYCSVCNQIIAYPVNYCPNCGADMRGEDHEAD